MTARTEALARRLSGLLEVGPLVAQAHGAVEDARIVEIGGEVAEPFELDNLARADVGQSRLDLRGDGVAAVRIEIVERVGAVEAGVGRAEQALVAVHLHLDGVGP